MSNEDTLERVRQFVSAANWFHDPHGVAVEIPHDVWRALQSRFLPGSESRHVGIDLALGRDRSVIGGVSPWYEFRLHHPLAFDFEGSVINPIRNCGSIQESGIAHRPRVMVFRDHLQLDVKWPRAVDWIAPEINPDALKEVIC